MSYPPPATPGYSPHPQQGDLAPPTRSGPHPLVWTALVIGVLVLGGIGWLYYPQTTTPSATNNGDPAAAFRSAAALPSCKELYVPGKMIDEKKAAAGCMGPHNVMSAGSFFNCGDGRALFSVNANSGAPAGWGFGGDKFHATKDSAADPGYGNAYAACIG